MATTTVRLDAEEERMLAELAPRYGGKSAALRLALRKLAVEAENRSALVEFVEDWNSAGGAPDEAAVDAMIEHFSH